jgi:hypothetical protein
MGNLGFGSLLSPASPTDISLAKSSAEVFAIPNIENDSINEATKSRGYQELRSWLMTSAVIDDPEDLDIITSSFLEKRISSIKALVGYILKVGTDIL